MQKLISNIKYQTNYVKKLLCDVNCIKRLITCMLFNATKAAIIYSEFQIKTIIIIN